MSHVASGESTQITGVNVHYEHEHCVVGLDPWRLKATHFAPGQPLVPQFTPDGSSLVYTGGTNRHPVIWIVPVAGKEEHALPARCRERLAVARRFTGDFPRQPARRPGSATVGSRRRRHESATPPRSVWDPVSVDSYRDLVY